MDREYRRDGEERRCIEERRGIEEGRAKRMAALWWGGQGVNSVSDVIKEGRGEGWRGVRNGRKMGDERRGDRNATIKKEKKI